MLDLVAELGRDVVDVAHAHPGGVLERHADHLLVRAFLVRHVEEADDADADPAARERRLADEHEGVERIAVLPHRPLDEAVVGGVAHRREQPAVEHDPTELRVELVLVARAGGHLDVDDDVGHLPEPADPLDEQVEEPVHVEIDADVSVHGPFRAAPAVDDGPSAAEIRVELDLDVPVDRGHKALP